MSFEVKENTFIIREVFEDVCDHHQMEILKGCQTMFKNIVRELYYSMKDNEGEWELTDETYDIIHDQVEYYLREIDGEISEPIVNEYGINNAFRDYINEYGINGTFNTENVSGCLAYHIFSQQLLNIPNQLWEDVVKMMYEIDCSENDFVFQRE
jgi:hypothetical protein